MSRLILGNDKTNDDPTKTYGSIFIYGNNGFRNNLISNESLSGNRNVQLPDSTGTLALLENFGDLKFSPRKNANSASTVTYSGTSNGRDFAIVIGDTNTKSILTIFTIHNGVIGNVTNLGEQSIAPTYSDNTLSIPLLSWSSITVIGYTQWT